MAYATDTILEMVRDICVSIGLDEPAIAVNSTDPKTKQIIRLIKRAGKELAGEHDWSVLCTDRTFTGIANQIQLGEPPASFDHFIPNTQLYDVGLRRPVIGALNSDEWLRVTVQAVTAVDKYWAIKQGVINILSVPAVTDSFRYGFVSKYWIRPTGETTNVNDKADFTADTDFPLMPSELLVLSTIWRWERAKGLDYAEDMATFERRKEKMIGDDRGPSSQSTTGAFFGQTPSNWWPGQIT